MNHVTCLARESVRPGRSPNIESERIEIPCSVCLRESASLEAASNYQASKRLTTRFILGLHDGPEPCALLCPSPVSYAAAKNGMKREHEAALDYPDEPDPESTEPSRTQSGTSTSDDGVASPLFQLAVLGHISDLSCAVDGGSRVWWQAFGEADWTPDSWHRESSELLMAVEWQSDQHRKDIASILACNDATFEFLLETSPDPQGLASTMSDYAVNLLGKRAGSLSKHGAPPYCYAGILAEWNDDMWKTHFARILETSVVGAIAAVRRASRWHFTTGSLLPFATAASVPM